MSMIVLPVDGQWIDRMIWLTGCLWERSVVDAEIVAWGLARSDEEIAWEGGAGWPQLAVDGTGAWTGWRLELGAEPPDPELFVRLSCALFWPAFGKMPEDARARFDGSDEFDELDGSDWDRRPDARRVDFHSERDRIAAMVSDRLGDPESVSRKDLGRWRAVWRCGGRALIVETTDDVASYSLWDLLAVQVRRYRPELAEPDK